MGPMSIQHIRSLEGLEWTLGDRLRKIRRREGISQGEFAEALGVNRKSIAAWESDINQPRTSVDLAKRIEKTYGVPAVWTLGLETGTPGPPGGPGVSYTTWDSNPEPIDLVRGRESGKVLQLQFGDAQPVELPDAA